MRLLKPQILLALLLVGCATGNKIPSNFDNTPVMLHASSLAQHDSIGFNIVQEIKLLIYPRLLTGDLPLWENPNKSIVISNERFKQMEQTAKLPFVNSADLFIHEIWQIFKHNFDFAPLGFSFTSESKYGKNINYGYVDIVDIIDLLKNNHIPNNANGDADITYWEALQSKAYYFNLVQFGKESFKEDPRRSVQLKNYVLYSNKVHRKFFPIIRNKEIEYRILNPKINSNEQNKIFYAQFQQVLNDNKALILNTGNTEFTHLMFAPWVLESVEVVERWSKHRNIAFQELSHVVVYIDGYEFKLDRQKLNELKTTINLQGIEEYLSEKSFDFVLQRINEENILPSKAPAYYTGLQQRKWNKIIPSND